MTAYFTYGEDAVRHLSERDEAMGRAIREIGPLRRSVVPDLFEALVHSIVGQQIATKAQETIWRRMTTALGTITPECVCALSREEVQAFGITFKKADNIKSAAQKITSGELDLAALRTKSDDEVCGVLTQLDGVGVWTAEMLMLFSMQRPDVLSYGDLALRRGMQVLYGLEKVDKKTFELYRKIYSPYGSVASLYLWELSTRER